MSSAGQCAAGGPIRADEWGTGGGLSASLDGEKDHRVDPNVKRPGMNVNTRVLGSRRVFLGFNAQLSWEEKNSSAT